MKELVYLFWFLVILAFLYFLFYQAGRLWRANSARRIRTKIMTEPWSPWEGDIEGHWVIQARRPGHLPLKLADAGRVDEEDFAYNVEVARSAAQEKFVALRPRGKWTLG